MEEKSASPAHFGSLLSLDTHHDFTRATYAITTARISR
jgi:hypothetical protein